MDYLKADFHCHVKLMARGKFRRGQLERRINAARYLGLDLLAVTEHIDVRDFWDIVSCLQQLCGDKTGRLAWKGMRLLAGAEVSIYEGGDILLIGSAGGLKELENRLGRLSSGNLPQLRDLLDASEDLGFLRIGAHPCRPGKVLWKIGPLLKRLDALEINARELSEAGLVRRRAREAGLAVLAGSDAHHWLQLGRVYNLIPGSNEQDIGEIKNALAENKTSWQMDRPFPCRFLNIPGYLTSL